MSLIWNIEYSNDVFTADRAWHSRKGENRYTVIQFDVSDSALNCVMYLVVGTLCWALSIVRGIFEHNILGVDSTPVFMWLVVIILISLFSIIIDNGQNPTRKLLNMNARLVH
jgi:hypothetical protein